MDDPIMSALNSLRKIQKKYYHFAKARNKFGDILYLMADSEEEIEIFCENGVLGDELAIEEWATNVTPIMASHHYKWVGSRRNPFVIARPIYKYVNGKYVGLREFRDKF
jgi:hypothetical protein